MSTEVIHPKTTRQKTTQQKKRKTPQNSRDRLLSALSATQRLTTQDAARLNQAVQGAREASIGDSLSS